MSDVLLTRDGPVATINPDNGDLTEQLASSNIGINYQNWRVGVVTGWPADAVDAALAASVLGADGSADSPSVPSSPSGLVQCAFLRERPILRSSVSTACSRGATPTTVI